MEVLLRCTKNHDGKPHDYVWTGPPSRRNCPACGNEHNLAPLVRIHLLVKHHQGPIRGAEGSYYVACDHAKKAIVQHVEAWSDQWKALTCPACLKSKEARKLQDDYEMEQFYRTGGLVIPASFSRTEDEPTPGPALAPVAQPPAPALPSVAEELPVQAQG